MPLKSTATSCISNPLRLGLLTVVLLCVQPVASHGEDVDHAFIAQCIPAMSKVAMAISLSSDAKANNVAFQTLYRAFALTETIGENSTELKGEWARQVGVGEEAHLALMGPCVDKYNALRRAGHISDDLERRAVVRARDALKR